eukprot:TRINITY_DN21608_c0_g1_i1.p1 TRINITY_DN21608_c0_g1~~TRINITY_DN21608_c0_g1_i1.p1  ORF type:complete len:232 (+),score=58.32 TRINITY_DN21608_c0_g1_i1:32-697(+)
MQDVSADMAKLAPNLKAVKRLGDVEGRLKDTNDELNKIREQARDTTDEYERIKKLRYDTFMKAFNVISEAIDQIYKELTRSLNEKNKSALFGTAYLHVEDQEEPYLAGIKYTTMPPTKRFREMDQLSGGERTVAALALLFAAHRIRPAPFFILDEVDAALDQANVLRVARYIQKKSPTCQFIVISLKDSFFSKSQGLIGIYREVLDNSSHTLTLDLSNFHE